MHTGQARYHWHPVGDAVGRASPADARLVGRNAAGKRGLLPGNPRQETLAKSGQGVPPRRKRSASLGRTQKRPPREAESVLNASPYISALLRAAVRKESKAASGWPSSSRHTPSPMRAPASAGEIVTMRWNISAACAKS